jgi:hypothetical protein
MRIPHSNFARALCLLVFVSVSLLASARDVALVVAKNSNLKAIQTADLAKAFKTPPAKWPDGKEIVFVIKAPATTETKVMGTKLLGQTAEVFPGFVAGAKKTFIVVATDDEVIKTVNSMPNAVGVVDLYSINGSVTVLKIDGKLPLEPGYLLHYN